MHRCDGARSVVVNHEHLENLATLVNSVFSVLDVAAHPDPKTRTPKAMGGVASGGGMEDPLSLFDSHPPLRAGSARTRVWRVGSSHDSGPFLDTVPSLPGSPDKWLSGDFKAGCTPESPWRPSSGIRKRQQRGRQKAKQLSEDIRANVLAAAKSVPGPASADDEETSDTDGCSTPPVRYSKLLRTVAPRLVSHSSLQSDVSRAPLAATQPLPPTDFRRRQHFLKSREKMVRAEVADMRKVLGWSMEKAYEQHVWDVCRIQKPSHPPEPPPAAADPVLLRQLHESVTITRAPRGPNRQATVKLECKPIVLDPVVVEDICAVVDWHDRSGDGRLRPGELHKALDELMDSPPGLTVCERIVGDYGDGGSVDKTGVLQWYSAMLEKRREEAQAKPVAEAPPQADQADSPRPRVLTFHEEAPPRPAVTRTRTATRRNSWHRKRVQEIRQTEKEERNKQYMTARRSAWSQVLAMTKMKLPV
eukprot:CAMPEP_0204324768 /NCGR_PEP_ID=MMETSP0469-20131031/10504_1 /ASSEMBLY_ACC=CAM_ASM_000384 /TAXON_ID=2969 /ORGANISM="Oxyrrhis marina" /LENGTH=474 /DNA_ID=CAMNT_0051306489 /DNA_START=82 /DNA_END=1507 /DNA_ORIENTATION=-